MKINKKYCIKEAYVHRTEWHHHDDTEHHNDDHQDEVYKIASMMKEKYNLKNVLDIGCGSGFKLMKYFKDCEPTGLEIEPTLSWLKNKYPNNNWQRSDFSKDIGDFDLIICSDVIEHIEDPDELMSFIKKINFKILVISTPERESIQKYQKGYTWNGPPMNLSHYREWAYEEFRNYISQFFDVRKQIMTKNKAEHRSLCQVVIAVKEKNV